MYLFLCILSVATLEIVELNKRVCSQAENNENARVLRGLVLYREKEKTLRIFFCVEMTVRTCASCPRKIGDEFLSYRMVLTLSDFIRHPKNHWVWEYGPKKIKNPLYLLKIKI